MRALLLEDRPDVRKTLARSLRAAAYLDVREAGTPEEALALVKNEPLDILFLDVRMSSLQEDRGGIGVLRKVRAMGHETPAVMLTCMDDFTTVRAAFQAGATRYVLKYELTFELIRSITAQLVEARKPPSAPTLRLVEPPPPPKPVRAPDQAKRAGRAAAPGPLVPTDDLRKLVNQVAECLLDEATLRARIRNDTPDLDGVASAFAKMPGTFAAKRLAFERASIARAWALSGENITGAAKLLGLERKAFARRRRKLFPD